MKHIFPFFLGFLMVFNMASGVIAMERIDDMTIVDNGQIKKVQAVHGETVFDVKPSGSAGRGMNDGYTGCSASNNVFPFDLTLHTAGTAIDLPGTLNTPYDMMMLPDGSEIWIADSTLDAVVMIDRATNAVIHDIYPGEYMIGIAFSGDGSIALATSRDSDRISVIDTSTYAITGTIETVTGEGIYACGFITYCPSNTHFYMSQWYGARLFEIAADGSAVLVETTIPGADLWQLVSSHDGSTLYICDRSADAVQIVDVATFTIAGSISVGDDPWGIDITSDDATLVVGCEDSHNVYIIDTGTFASQIVALTSGDDPRDVDISSDDSLAYVATGDNSPNPDRVVVIDIASAGISTSIEPTGAGTTNSVSVNVQMGGSAATPTPSSPTPTPGPQDIPSTTVPGIILLLTLLSLGLWRRYR